MRTITFKPNDGPVITLADAWNRNLLCTMYHPPLGQQLIQPEDFPRGEAMQFYARGNVQNTIPFTVRRQFANRVDSHLFQHEHPQSLAGRGTFTSIVLIGGGGGQVVGLNFVMRVLDIREEGVALHIDYEAIGGLLNE